MLKNGRLWVFPRLLRHYFPPCSLERTRDPRRPSPQTVRRAPSTCLAPAFFLASTPVRSVSFGTPCLSPAAQNGSHNRPKSGSSGERPVFRPSPLRAHVPRRTLPPFLVQGPFLTQPRSSGGPGPERSAVPKASPPRRRQARHECAEHWALNRSHPRSPASRMQIRTGRSSPASALSGATRSAQSRNPAPLAARHRPPSPVDPGQAALMHGAACPDAFLHSSTKTLFFAPPVKPTAAAFGEACGNFDSFARRAADARSTAVARLPALLPGRPPHCNTRAF